MADPRDGAVMRDRIEPHDPARGRPRQVGPPHDRHRTGRRPLPRHDHPGSIDEDGRPQTSGIPAEFEARHRMPAHVAESEAVRSRDQCGLGARHVRHHGKRRQGRAPRARQVDRVSGQAGARPDRPARPDPRPAGGLLGATSPRRDRHSVGEPPGAGPSPEGDQALIVHDPGGSTSARRARAIEPPISPNPTKPTCIAGSIAAAADRASLGRSALRRPGAEVPPRPYPRRRSDSFVSASRRSPPPPFFFFFFALARARPAG